MEVKCLGLRLWGITATPGVRFRQSFLGQRPGASMLSTKAMKHLVLNIFPFEKKINMLFS